MWVIIVKVRIKVVIGVILQDFLDGNAAAVSESHVIINATKVQKSFKTIQVGLSFHVHAAAVSSGKVVTNDGSTDVKGNFKRSTVWMLEKAHDYVWRLRGFQKPDESIREVHASTV